MKKYSIIVFSLFICIILSPCFIFAKDSFYTIDGDQRVPMPVTYMTEKVMFSFSGKDGETIRINRPEDMFIYKEHIYIVDTGNNRILKTTKAGVIVDIFGGPSDKPLAKPEGIFVDSSGSMFVADTGNGRIVHLNSKGEYVEQFVKPDSELLDEVFTFRPSKVIVSPTGYIYTVRYPSIMIIDAFNRFRGFFAQVEINFNLRNAIVMMFASERQRTILGFTKAISYNNLTLAPDGMIYATTRESVGDEIRKLNAVGNNIYRTGGAVQSGMNLFSLNFLSQVRIINKVFRFGERLNDKGEPIVPVFLDIAVDKNGFVTVVEENTGKLYQYDQEGNLLTVFGGKAERIGMFNQPVSIETDDDGKIYVLDKQLGSITIFQPTRFIGLIHEATNMYMQGEYAKSQDLWQEVLNINENYTQALIGIAQNQVKQQNWKSAMNLYEQIMDREEYSKAFSKYRHQIFRQYFALVLLGFILVILSIIFYFKAIKRNGEKATIKFTDLHPNRMSTLNMLGLSLNTIIHPIATFEIIKNNRKNINYVPSIIILLLVLFTRIFFIFTVHFPFADVDTRETNLFLEAIIYLLPILTWVLASFAITSISDGESKLGEVFVASSFCMLPYIIITIPLALISNLMGRGETALFGFLSNGAWIWVFVLLIICHKEINRYHFIRTVGTGLISMASMVLMWSVSLLGAALLIQLYKFLSGIWIELQMSLL